MSTASWIRSLVLQLQLAAVVIGAFGTVGVSAQDSSYYIRFPWPAYEGRRISLANSTLNRNTSGCEVVQAT